MASRLGILRGGPVARLDITGGGRAAKPAPRHPLLSPWEHLSSLLPALVCSEPPLSPGAVGGDRTRGPTAGRADAFGHGSGRRLSAPGPVGCRQGRRQ
jgi:hypothetical protein